jgi:hypothetical protein
MIYKLYKTTPEKSNFDAVMTIGVSPAMSFLFAPTNADYQNFKAAINTETAELQYDDGNTMTTEEANEFIATLP